MAALFAAQAPAQLAPPPPPPGIESTPAAPSAEGDDIASLRSMRDSMVRVNDFAAALDPAKEVVERLEGSGDPQLPTHIMTLARIQTELGELDEAERNYLRAIELVELRDGELAMSLVEPYQSLGRAYIKGARFPEAIAALEHAQHITQRNLGLFNIEQVDLIDDMTIAFLSAGDTVEAQRLQEQRLRTALRRFGPEDPRVIPFRYHLADYYGRSRMRQHAREQYEEVLALQTSAGEANGEELLPTLRELVRIDLIIGENSPSRDRLMEILASNPNVSPVEKARSLAVLGDWEMARTSIASGLSYYRQAYAALQADPQVDPEEFFAQPVMIDFVPPLSPVDRRALRRAYGWGTIVLRFDLSADGRVSGVQVVEADPAGVMDEAYSRRLLETHFRPRMAAGEPVATRGVEFTHHFRYYVDDEDQDDGEGEEQGEDEDEERSGRDRA